LSSPAFRSLLGPEMRQNERNEVPAATLEYEQLRRKGISLLDIDTRTAKGDFKVAKAEANGRKG
jgi:hypothetical protein